jgi:hypothetical protein
MNRKSVTLALAGITALALLITGGCCHMHRHHCDKQPRCNMESRCDKAPTNCNCSCNCAGCDQRPGCDKAGKPGCDMHAAGKPCCDKGPGNAPAPPDRKP